LCCAIVCIYIYGIALHWLWSVEKESESAVHTVVWFLRLWVVEMERDEEQAMVVVVYIRKKDGKEVRMMVVMVYTVCMVYSY
jgi:hypothetical protein